MMNTENYQYFSRKIVNQNSVSDWGWSVQINNILSHERYCIFLRKESNKINNEYYNEKNNNNFRYFPKCKCEAFTNRLLLATSPLSTARRNFFSMKVRTPICWWGGRSGDSFSLRLWGAARLWYAIGVLGPPPAWTVQMLQREGKSFICR